jgi:hypothetical protein
MPVHAPTCYGQRLSRASAHWQRTSPSRCSHAQDDPKKLKYEEMVAIRDAVVTAQQLSAAMLRRNMQMHDSPTKTIPAEHMCSGFQDQVYRAAKSCVPNNSMALTWMTLTASCKSLLIATCGQRWCTGTTILYHIGLHDFCVIGHQNKAAFNVLRMSISSLWMLTHSFRAIKAGWGFQLNADVTGKLCRKSVNLLAFSVDSIPKRNNTLCLCIIPSTTESEQAYTVVYNELR